MIEMNGKLQMTKSCLCCEKFNFKKINKYKDKSYIQEAYDYFDRTVTCVIGFNGEEWFDKLAHLFKNEKSFYVWCDHPVGEDVVYVNGKYSGYLNDWYEMIDFCEKSDFKFKTHKDVYNFYMENIYDYDE